MSTSLAPSLPSDGQRNVQGQDGVHTEKGTENLCDAIKGAKFEHSSIDTYPYRTYRYPIHTDIIMTAIAMNNTSLHDSSSFRTLSEISHI